MIEIKMGLKDEYIRTAAEIYTEAFYGKYSKFVKDKEKIIRILESDMVNEYAICAYNNDKLIGLAGVHHKGKTLVELRYRTFLKVFGFAGLFVYPLLKIFYNRKPKKNELLMDGLAVSPDMRGKGAGTKLLNGVFDFARKHGYTSIRLDVIDTNPRAKSLYERMGFETVKIRNYPYLKNITGFTKVLTMVNRIETGLKERGF